LASYEPGVLDLAACRADIERAHTEVGDIAKEGAHRRWRMSIPAQPNRDSDLLISTGLARGEHLADEVERLRATIQRVRDHHQPETPPEGHQWVSGGRVPHCVGCATGDPYLDAEWPCDTIRLVDGEDLSAAEDNGEPDEVTVVVRGRS
jgi:hypothetical protein